jgi:hypothetical protein
MGKWRYNSTHSLTSALDRGEYLGADGKITLECILGIQGENMWTECIRLRIGPVTGSHEHGNETSGSITGGEFLN